MREIKISLNLVAYIFYSVFILSFLYKEYNWVVLIQVASFFLIMIKTISVSFLFFSITTIQKIREKNNIKKIKITTRDLIKRYTFWAIDVSFAAFLIYTKQEYFLIFLLIVERSLSTIFFTALNIEEDI